MASPTRRIPLQRGGLSRRMRKLDSRLILIYGAVLSLISVAKSFTRLNGFISKAHVRLILSMSTVTAQTYDEHCDFIRNIAKADPPKKLDLLLKLVELTGDEKIVSPTARQGLNPFLIPISRRIKDGSFLCYIRWPTQKENMDLQLVRTTDVGIYLVAMGTDQYCHRLAVEQDFYCLPTATTALELLNESGQVSDIKPATVNQTKDCNSQESYSIVGPRWFLNCLIYSTRRIHKLISSKFISFMTISGF